MSTTEELLTDDRLELYRGIAAEGAELLGVAIDDLPLKVIEAINQFIAEPKQVFSPKECEDAKIDNWTDRALPIGALWGQTMVSRFGWHWASLIQHDHDDLRVTAAINQDRSLVIYPFHYCFGCLENHIYPTILLAFNMLESGFIPPVPPNGFFNMMDGVRHIIPPR